MYLESIAYCYNNSWLINTCHHGQGSKMVSRSHTAMDRSTVLVGDLIDSLLSTEVMLVNQSQ